jgi:dihydroflavonol-4-reductase
MIFVTGGTGLTGSRLLLDLALQGNEIIALKRKGSSIAATEFQFRHHPELLKNINWIEEDITSAELFRIIPVNSDVYHCAGLVSFDPSDRKQLNEVNVRGTENLVNACLENKIRKLVYISSVATLGRDSGSIYIDENSHWEISSLSSDYAISKYGAEREVWRGIAEGLNAVIVNPSIIIGHVFREGGSSSMIVRAGNGLNFYTEGISGFVDAADVTAVMIELMKSDIAAERFILNSENISYHDFFSAAANAFHKKAPAMKAEKWMASLMWRFEKISQLLTQKKPLITKYTASNAFKKYRYSNEKIASALNFKFKPVAQSINEACDAYTAWKKSASVNV